jgi:hypothetical protein
MCPFVCDEFHFVKCGDWTWGIFNAVDPLILPPVGASSMLALQRTLSAHGKMNDQTEQGRFKGDNFWSKKISILSIEAHVLKP